MRRKLPLLHLKARWAFSAHWEWPQPPLCFLHRLAAETLPSPCVVPQILLAPALHDPQSIPDVTWPHALSGGPPLITLLLKLLRANTELPADC